MAARLSILDLRNASVHAIGASGLETSAMCLYLVEKGCTRITLHDRNADFQGSFERVHRLQPPHLVSRTWEALSRCADLRTAGEYLRGIGEAEALLVPQSWFLDVKNAELPVLKDRFILFPDACFDLFKGKVIGVTGSYGKTTTTRFAAALTGGVAGGNDREALMDLAALETAADTDVMAFEISNRHLKNGFSRRIEAGILTGITLNHEPDHGSFDAYRRLKYSMGDRCRAFFFNRMIAFTYPDAAALFEHGTAYGTAANDPYHLTGDWVHGPQGPVCSLAEFFTGDSSLRLDVLAAIAGALACGTSQAMVEERLHLLHGALPRYRRAREVHRDRVVINDAASCMPASTAALVRDIARPAVLICGGDRQLFRPGEFDVLAKAVAHNPEVRRVIVIGSMAAHIAEALAAAGCHRVSRAESLEEAAVQGLLGCRSEDVVFSPGCGTGREYDDKYERGERFDEAVHSCVSRPEARD